MSVSGGIQGLHFVNTMSNAGLRAGATEAQGIIAGMGRNIGKLAPFAPLAAGGLILAKLADDAYDFSNEFSMAMREVQTISKSVQEDWDGMGRSIVNLAAQGPDDAIELAKAFYQIVSAGYDGAEGLNLLDVASRSATAGITDTKTAADGLTTILNAWGKSASEAENVADIMFKTVEKGKTTFPELAQNIATVAPMASAMGISLEEIMGAVASLTKQGNTTAVAMTQIRQAIIGLNDNLGDGWSSVMTFQEALQKLRDMSEGSDTKLKEMMGRVEGMNAVLSLTGDKATEAAGDLDAMSNSVDAMQKAYTTMMDEADNKWSMVHNKWQRELKSIGDAVKIASSGWADLLNALLTNEGDMGNAAPTIGSFQDRVAGNKMLGQGGLSAWISAISPFPSLANSNMEARLYDIFKQGQEGFNERESQLSELLGIEDAKKRAEELSAFLKKMTSERDTDLGAKSIGPGGETIYETRRSNWRDLISLIEEAIEKANNFDAGGGGGNDGPKAGTVAASIAKIDELKEKLGTGDAAFEIQVRFQIAEEQAKIDEFYTEVREKFEQAINESWTAPFNRTVGADGTNSKLASRGDASKLIAAQTKEIKGQLQPMKQLTEEEIKQLEAEHEKIDAQRTQIENQEEMANVMHNNSEILGAMSYAFGEVDESLGEILGRMSDITRNAGNMFSSLASGNLASAFASGVGIFGNIIGAFVSDNDNAYDRLTKTLDSINTSLERQAQLLSILSGEDYFALADSHAQKLRESISQITSELNAYGQSLAEGMFGDQVLEQLGFNTSGWTVEDWVNKLSEGGPVLDQLGQFDEINEMISQIIKLQQQLDDLGEDTFLEKLGFGTNDIANTLSDGITQGLKLSEGGLGDFADNFRDQLNDAILQAVLGPQIDQQIQAYMEKMKDFADIEEDGSMFSEQEKAELEDLYRQLIANTQQRADELGFMLDESIAESGLQGISRSITEETGSLIVGQFSSMREYQVRANDTMMDQLGIAEEQLEVLQDIRDNTAHNIKLNSIDERLETMNETLKTGLAV